MEKNCNLDGIRGITKTVVEVSETDREKSISNKSGITVGDLKKLLADVDDDLYVVVPVDLKSTSGKLTYASVMQHVMNPITKEEAVTINYKSAIENEYLSILGDIVGEEICDDAENE